MLYTAGEAAKILGIPASTLRYYDKEGLLPELERPAEACACSVIQILRACGSSSA